MIAAEILFWVMIPLIPYSMLPEPDVVRVAQIDAQPEKAVRDRMVLVTAPGWCEPCQRVERQFPQLAKVGWKIGKLSSDHIQVIDSDLHPSVMNDLKVTALPTLIHFRGDQEVRRHVGFISAVEMSRFMEVRK